MKKMQIEEGYCYLPEANLLVNQETLNKFENYFKKNKVKLDDVNVDEDFIRHQINNITQIIIGVTESCNQRCLYCVYDGNYLYENKLTGRHLNFNIAKKGLDYISNFVKDRFDKKLTISFYGGEPFIKFDLIKKIVSYSKKLLKDWKLNFGATTNATLLKDEIIEFLVAENFNILVSLDGPAKIHDSKRVFRNGKETFNKVWKTLERIKKINNDYYNKKISFNIVYSYDQSIVDVYNFFTENELIVKNKAYFSQVVTKNTDYYEKINYDAEEVRNNFRLILAKIKEKNKKSIEFKPLEERFFQHYIDNKSFNIQPNNVFSGTCFFNSRLFIDIEGKFNICESINNRFPIGDVNRGFDFGRMVEIAKEFENIKKEYCQKCDINYLCRPCYVIFASDGKLELDTKFCSRYKKNVIKNLKEKISFEQYKREKNVKAKSKIYRFHQFISTVKGTINTALVDFISGDIFHVPNKVLEDFNNRKYEKIPEFIKAAKEYDLIIYVDNNTWITKQTTTIDDLKFFDAISAKDIVLCIEEGADLLLVKQHVSNFNINKVFFYGSITKKIDHLFPGLEISYENYDYHECSNLSIIKKDDFVKIDEEYYNFAQVCNNCWGHKIAITKDGKIRPCIYSNIIIDDLQNLNSPKTIEKIKSYWYITKDKVENCKDCELRYFCIDCREKAQRENSGNLLAPNPNCKYDPYTGIWNENE